ncbi:ADP-ribose pyrophosphatase YjhB (NUDIX family) [Runella defluvii]|uniref:ADP-ribose pyrophosphatase YjhB (NUDIX family) n=1 Tax=Runella defluvii TaxID=370973 RepID=A0A7W6ESP3_9BACT|nr:NUDIX domain-containing protein [Runella defluvii]MBB3840676.1 ADP-ribose pyrophosphatase YjhB (NUDIX family) [Runella defluvii]
MEKAREEVARLYGNRLRIRVCGVCIQHNKILMLSHRGIGNTDVFWCPPGGGIQFEESTLEALQREFVEETGLEVEVGNLLFVNEFMQPPLHALELFFEVKVVGGQQHLGSDPEMTDANQIIQEMKWMSIEDIKKYPANEVHAMFKYCDSLEAIYDLKGYLGHVPAEMHEERSTRQIVFQN